MNFSTSVPLDDAILHLLAKAPQLLTLPIIFFDVCFPGYYRSNTSNKIFTRIGKLRSQYCIVWTILEVMYSSNRDNIRYLKTL